MRIITQIYLWASLLIFQLGECSPPKLYLTANESSLLFPQQYIDQTIYTRYEIQSSPSAPITVHNALERIYKFSGILEIARNPDGQMLADMAFIIPDFVILYYINQQGNLVLSSVKGKTVHPMGVVPLGDWIRNSNSTEQNNRTVNILGMKIMQYHHVLVWNNRGIRLITIQQQDDKNITYQITVGELPLTFEQQLMQCNNYQQQLIYCTTIRNIVQFQLPESGPYPPQLSILHILSPPTDCLLSALHLQADIVCVCDCYTTCYNYQVRQDSTLQQIISAQIIGIGSIQVIKEAEGTIKGATLVLGGQNIIVLVKLSYHSIDIVDSMLLPEVDDGQLWDITISGDNICLKYKTFSGVGQFVHIFIQYDTTRLQYDQLNSILASSFVFPLYRVLYNIDQAGQLSLRVINPYYLLIQHIEGEELANITIRAFNTGKIRTDGQMETENITIIVVGAVEGQVYVNEQLISQVSNNYQYSYPMELYQYFVGRIKKFIFAQTQLPVLSTFKQEMGSSSSIQNKQQITESVVINTHEDKKILSIYNLLQCIRLVKSGTFTFLRLMTIPASNRIYIEECKAQKADNRGDFICQIKQIADRIYQNKQRAEQVQKQSEQWQIVDIGIASSLNVGTKINRKQKRARSTVIVQILRRNITSSKFEQCQYQIITQHACMRFKTSSQGVVLVQNRYLLIASHVNSHKNGKGKLHKPDIKLTIYDSHTNNNMEAINVNVNSPIQQSQYSYADDVRITNVFAQLADQGIHSWQYRVLVGYQINNNYTHAIIFDVILPKDKYNSNYANLSGNRIRNQRCKVRIHQRYELMPQLLVIYVRFYSKYLYTFNSTHVTKYSLLTIANSQGSNKSSPLFPLGSILYTHALQLKLGNSLQYVRNVGKYMLLVYLYSYRILNLQGQLLQLVVDDHLLQQSSLNSYHKINQGSVSSSGVYDMITIGSDTLLLGINNIMRSYDRNLLVTIGPYPMREGQIKTYHRIQLSAVSPSMSQLAPIMATTQVFNLTINYETTLIQVRGKAIKMLRDLPFSAKNQYIIIYETMFTGPIQQYYIGDFSDGAIQVVNHMQKISDSDDGKTSSTKNRNRSTGNKKQAYNKQNELKSDALNRLLSVQTMVHIQTYNYYMSLKQKAVHQPQTNQSTSDTNINTNININVLYCNGSHAIVVTIGSQQGSGYIRWSAPIPGFHNSSNKYACYYQIFVQDYLVFVMYSTKTIVYMNIVNNTPYVVMFQVYKVHGWQVKQMSVLEMGNERMLVMLLANTTSTHENISIVNRKLGCINLTDNLTKITIISQQIDNIQYMAVMTNVVVYVTVRNDAQFDMHFGQVKYICVQSMQSFVPVGPLCTNMLHIVPPIYYISDVEGYYHIEPISYYRYNSTSKQYIKLKILLLSRHASAYHLEIDATLTHQISNDNWLVQSSIRNCYVSLSGYQAHAFIALYNNESTYDYFILQYMQMQGETQQLQQLDSILVFYRHNDYSGTCGNIGGWVNIGAGQIANLLPIPDPDWASPKHSYLLSLTQLFHVQKNLTLLLNYKSPPPVHYTLFNARNPQFYNKFYSKFEYEDDPSQKYFWLYCWIGFGAVAIFLAILKVISILIDRGVIRWNKSLSEDGDNVERVTVHYDSSGAMLTEDSYKTLQ